MKALFADRKGNFSLTLALLIVPIFGAAGVAVDYTRAVSARSYFQELADQAALSGARLGNGGDTTKIKAYTKSSAETAKGRAFTANAVAVDDKWISAQDYSVTVSGRMPTTILAAIPGFPNSVAISASATAEAGKPKRVYSLPKFSSLDPDAYDYNQLSVYCFDPDKASDPKTHGRSQETLIADNAGTTYNYTMPECLAGETLSFHMHNVRNTLHDAQQKVGANASNSKLMKQINTLSKTADKYDYFTDTTIAGGVEDYKLKEPMLETVLCDTYDDCKPQSKGGVLPTGSGRTPQHATQACDTGKYLYYGWEDRPPSSGSDRDYNDIRVIMACPTVTIVGYDNTRLIR